MNKQKKGGNSANLFCFSPNGEQIVILDLLGMCEILYSWKYKENKLTFQALNSLNTKLTVCFHFYLENEFNPIFPEILKWTFSSLRLDMSTSSNRGFSVK